MPPKKRLRLPPNVNTVTEWLRSGLFRNEDEARGAFRLARQQYLDGMGGDTNWMGMTSAEFDAWMKHGTLPSGGKFRV